MERGHQGEFFGNLQRAIVHWLALEVDRPNGGYGALSALLREQAERGWRFLLVIDEFEEMTANPRFDATFFSNLHALGDRPEYRLGYLIASRRSLEIKYALGVAGIAAAGSLVYQMLHDGRSAFFTGLGMFLFMGLLFVFAKLGQTIPESARLTFIWFLIGWFILVCSLLVTSVFFQWPLPLGAWAMGR